MAYGIRIRMDDGRYKDISQSEISPMLLMSGLSNAGQDAMDNITLLDNLNNTTTRINLISYAMMRVTYDGYPSRRNQFISLGDATRLYWGDVAPNSAMFVNPKFDYALLARPDLGNKTGNVGIRIDGRSVFNTGVDKLFIPSQASYKRVMDLQNGVFDPRQISPELTPFNALYFFHSEDNSCVWPRITNGGYLRLDDGRLFHDKGVELFVNTRGKATGRFRVVVFKLLFADEDNYPQMLNAYFTAVEKGLDIGNKKAGLLLRDDYGRVTYVSGVDVLYKVRTLDMTRTAPYAPQLIPDIKRPMYSPSVIGFHQMYSQADPLFISNTSTGTGVQMETGPSLASVLVPQWGANIIYQPDGTYGGMCVTQDPLVIIDADDYF